jgi:D-alanine transaminase
MSQNQSHNTSPAKPAPPVDRVVYLNGSIVPRSAATLDIEDRAALFADGVYEVIRYYQGKPFALDLHVNRLAHSLAAIDIPAGDIPQQLARASAQLIALNQTPDAKLYWQVSRGVAPRDHAFDPNLKPTVLAIAYPLSLLNPSSPPALVRTILHPDQRWSECWIKSLMLLPNTLARQRARAAGASEAIFHRDNTITEGAATNVFVVRKGEVWTHPADHWVLPGVTRAVVIELANELGLTVHPWPVNTEQLLAADEVFLTGTTTHISAVTHIDSAAIAGGGVGPVTMQLHEALMARVKRECL